MSPTFKNATRQSPNINGTRHPVSIEMIRFDPEWQFEDQESGVFYKNGIIPNKLFITYLGGVINPECANKALEILENMFGYGLLHNCEYIRIADYNEVISAPFTTRILYANTLNRLNSKYNCRPSITYICGASILLKTMLRLFSSYVKQQFIFVPSVQDALHIINTPQTIAIAEKDQQITISQKEIDRFASLCGELLFNETVTFEENNYSVTPENPLHDLYTIITLLNDDLKELRKTEKEQKFKIEESLDQSRMLNSRLAVEKKNVEEKELIQQILIDNLNQAKIDAEIAIKAKSEFLANISHEIITPLHAVIGMTELLCCTPLNDEQKSYADTIQISTQLLHQLLNNILDFSIHESGKLDTEKSLFNIQKLFDDVLSLLIDEALKKGLQLTFAIVPSVPEVLSGYPAYLLKAILNLVQNAIKFTNKGEIVVSVETVSESPDEISLRISVKDSGIGIPDGKKELIFQKFTQLDSSATRKQGGTGLGLTIAKQLIEFMGGKLDVISRENEGSEFWFTASFIKPKDNNISNSDRTSLPCQERHHSQQPLDKTLTPINKILLVEDNIINQRVTTAMLNKLDFEVEIAANGVEAIDALKEKVYSLVIMDLQMPIMGGIEATQEIRSKKSGVLNPDITIVAMTANSTMEDKKNCKDAGMNDFISKPVMMPTLQELLNKWVTALP